MSGSAQIIKLNYKTYYSVELNLKQIFILLSCCFALSLWTACEDETPEPQPSSPYSEEDQLLETQLQSYLSHSYSCEISSVEVTDQSVIVKGKIPSGYGTVYLGEVPLYEDLVTMQHFDSSLPVTEDNFTLVVERYADIDGTKYDRLLSKWVLFTRQESKDEIVSAAHYPDVIHAVQDLEALKLRNKKGIGGLIYNQFISDVDVLDISSATVNVILDSFFHLNQMGSDTPYEYGGRTYYVNEKYLQATLDKVLRVTAKRKIPVAAIILLQRAENCSDPDFGALMQHPDNTGGAYTMPNMTTLESVNAYAAAINYLASRYCRKNDRYGRISHWIMQNEVDASIQWANMGNKPVTVFTDTYVKSLRLCYNIVRQYDAHSEVFASFTHSWTAPCQAGWNSSLEIITLLNRYSKVEGDFQWALAYHSYPYDLYNPRSWEDPLATVSMNTQFVTFRNLEVLNRWALTGENMYKGKIKRSIWLSEAGINSRSYSEESLKEQAAGFAYAWKKLNGLEGIDGLQWHNWFDNEGDGPGVMLGLRKYPDKNDGEPKPVWDLYRQAATETEDEAFAPSLEYIGIKDWNIIEPF